MRGHSTKKAHRWLGRKKAPAQVARPSAQAECRWLVRHLITEWPLLASLFPLASGATENSSLNVIVLVPAHFLLRFNSIISTYKLGPLGKLEHATDY